MIESSAERTHYNARWYDPGTGCFASEDPALDDQNLYRYVGNNAVNATDPSGLFTSNLGGVADQRIVSGQA